MATNPQKLLWRTWIFVVGARIRCNCINVVGPSTEYSTGDNSIKRPACPFLIYALSLLLVRLSLSLSLLPSFVFAHTHARRIFVCQCPLHTHTRARNISHWSCLNFLLKNIFTKHTKMWSNKKKRKLHGLNGETCPIRYWHGNFFFLSVCRLADASRLRCSNPINYTCTHNMPFHCDTLWPWIVEPAAARTI